MTTTTFDTLGSFEKLKAAGIPENQAKAQVEVIREVIEDKLATKRDLKELELMIRQEISTVRQEMKELELRLTTRFGAMIAAAVAILAALIVLMK